MLYASLPDIAGRIAAAPPERELTRKVGVEIEVQGDRTRQAQALRLAGLAHPSGSVGSGSCGYHCSLPACGEYIVHPQADGSISGVEAIVGGPVGTPVDSPVLHEAIERTTAVLTVAGAVTTQSNGGHVHVDRFGLDYTVLRRLIDNAVAVRVSLKRLMAADSLNGIRPTSYGNMEVVFTEFERSGFTPSGVRPGYMYGNRSAWMWFSANTVEFRGWNGTLLPWRVAMAAYVSAAMVEAAVQGIVANPGEDVLDHVGAFLPHYIKMLVVQQNKYQAGEGVDLADDKEVPVAIPAEPPVSPIGRLYRCEYTFTPGTYWVETFNACSQADAARQALRWLDGRETWLAAAMSVDVPSIRNARVRAIPA